MNPKELNIYPRQHKEQIKASAWFYKTLCIWSRNQFVFVCDYSLQWCHNGQITSLTIVYSIIYSDADQRKHQSYASLSFVCGIHRGPVNSPHKWPVTQKMFLFDDVIKFENLSTRWKLYVHLRRLSIWGFKTHEFRLPVIRHQYRANKGII